MTSSDVLTALIAHDKDRNYQAAKFNHSQKGLTRFIARYHITATPGINGRPTSNWQDDTFDEVLKQALAAIPHPQKHKPTDTNNE